MIYIEYPLMVFLVIDGVSKMDIYHLMFIIFFVIYTLFPKVLNKYAIVLLVYADIFVLIKYIYTLLATQEVPSHDFMLLIGFSTSFNPDTTNEYFRYHPSFDSWALVVLSLILYRR